MIRAMIDFYWSSYTAQYLNVLMFLFSVNIPVTTFPWTRHVGAICQRAQDCVSVSWPIVTPASCSAGPGIAPSTPTDALSYISLQANCEPLLSNRTEMSSFTTRDHRTPCTEETRNAYKILVGNFEGKRLIRRPRRRWQNTVNNFTPKKWGVTVSSGFKWSIIWRRGRHLSARQWTFRFNKSE
jgi:hypothetical protein